MYSVVARPERPGGRFFDGHKFIFSIWLPYLVGAGTGTWMQSGWGVRSVLVPAGIVAIAVIVDQVTPLSIPEEHEELES